MWPSRVSLRDLKARIGAAERRELLVRAGQEVQKRFDWAAYCLGLSVKAATDSSPSRRAQFFFNPDQVSRLSALLRQRLPDNAQDVVRRAERICDHRYDLLGYNDLDYAAEIDWHLDRVHEKVAPRKPWYKIRYLDFHEVGDTKVTWELNRHQHLVTLAKAYSVSREQRFGEEALAQWYHWHSQNPYPAGVNWASSLEVAFRSLSWLWMRALLESAGFLPKRFRLDCLQSLATSGRHIEKYLSTYFSPNTHLLGEAVGLFFIGTLCPELSFADRWQELGWRIVLQQAERQVQDDGMHFEQSTYYHVYALDLFLHASLLASCNGIPIPNQFNGKLLKMAEALCSLGYAGLLPQFGDDDGGRVFDAKRNRAEHLLDPLAIAAVMFARSDFKFVASELSEAALWLLGEDGVRRFDQLDSEAPAGTSSALQASGLYVMKSARPVRQALVVTTHEKDVPFKGHAHADALSIQVIANGRALLRDSGTGVYTSDGPTRNLLRGTGAHNTLTIDRVDQSKPKGPFSWVSYAHGRIDRWVAGETFDYLAAAHDGYSDLPGSPVHKRSIFHCKSHFWLVRDRIEGFGEHHLQLSWHLAPGLGQQRGEDQRFTTRDGRMAIGIVGVGGQSWRQSVAEELWSPVYGREEHATVLRLENKAMLPTEMVTLLVPLFDGGSELGMLARTSAGAGWPAAYEYKIGGEKHRFFFAEGKPWRSGGWSSDAEMLYCRTGPELTKMFVALVQGSYVDFMGQRIVSSTEPHQYAELSEGKIAGPEAQLMTLHFWPGHATKMVAHKFESPQPARPGD